MASIKEENLTFITPLIIFMWCFKVHVATAYRLEPLTPRGILSLDGETVEYGPIQVRHRRDDFFFFMFYFYFFSF